MKKRPELVIALDLPDSQEALRFAELLKGHVKWLKIGLQLFIAGGPEIVRNLRSMGFKIFLDLKFYDIPNTVANAVNSACVLDVSMLTIHAQGGRIMCQAALDAASKTACNPLVACVTALTSFGDGDMPGIAASPEKFAIELAGMVASWGMKAIVCSPKEAAEIKKFQPDLKCVCPGIRPAGASSDDQKRSLGPAEAIAYGADFLVVGRPVLKSPDPTKTVSEIIGAMDAVSFQP